MSSPAPDALQTALALVIDPELRRNVVELGMVDADRRRRRPRARHDQAHGARAARSSRTSRRRCGCTSAPCPASSVVTIGFTHMDEQQRAALRAQLQGGRSEGERHDRRRGAHARHRRRLGQGRRRQVVADGQPRARAARSGPRGRRRRRRHLRLLDPGHARHPAAPGRRGQDDRPARGARPQGDVDRVLPRRRRLGRVARPDAAPRARAVPLRRLLGPARLPADRHAARAPATSASRSGSCCRAPRPCSSPRLSWPRSAWPRARRRWSRSSASR